MSRKVKEVLPFDGDIKSVNKTYYDKNSNVIKQAVQNNVPGEAEHFKVTEFKYDAMGNVLASIGKDAGGDSVVQYEYNLANKPTKMITGLSEYSENQTGGNVTSYTYEDGYLKEITDPLGQSESYTYDWLGNMLTKKDRNEVNHTYTYGIYGLEETTAGNLKTTTAYDNLGRVTSQAQYEDNTLTDSISYTYDAFGRVISENQGNIERAYAYDANNNKTSYTLKENGEQKTQNTYSYNALNQLTNQTIDDTILTYQYNPLGNIISKQVGNIETAYTYNAGQHLTGLTNQNGEIQYSGYTYAYQLDGNRTNETDTSGIQKSYSYDDLGRLTTEAITGSDITQSMAYTYDNRGNRLTKTENGALTSYTYDANNRLMSEVSDNDSTSYYYDANGNTVSKSIGTFANEGETSVSVTNTALNLTAYDYDALNRLTSITSGENATSYTYGVNNLRKSKTENNTTIGYVWNGQNMVAETAGNTIQKIHNYALDGITLTTQGEENSFYIKNAHGDVTATADTNGNVSSSYLYDAFGNQLSDNENDTNPFRYCGEYFDEESEMIYLRNRYYSPSNGRFITEDPIKDGLNWYVYCSNNPIQFVDPIGLVITSNSNDKDIVLEQLQQLTDDELGYEEILDDEGNGTGTFQFVILNSYDTNRHVGQELVSCLINTDDVVNINVGVPDINGDINTKWPAINDPNNIIQIYIDPKDSLGNGTLYTHTIGQNGIHMQEAFPQFILVGHELIHAWRELNGLFDYNVETGFIPFDKNMSWPAEEIKTMGINYTDSSGKTMQNYSTYDGVISENGLRIENGINQRISYQGWWVK